MVTFPESMDDLVYFTRRKLGDKGSAIAWVYRGDCPACGKDKMGKPRDPKTGRPKIRATEYICPSCENVIEKQEYEDSLECELQYTCPKCENKGELATPFKRKSFPIVDPDTGKKKAAKAIVFHCESCSEKLGITKKLK